MPTAIGTKPDRWSGVTLRLRHRTPRRGKSGRCSAGPHFGPPTQGHLQTILGSARWCNRIDHVLASAIGSALDAFFAFPQDGDWESVQDIGPLGVRDDLGAPEAGGPSRQTLQRLILCLRGAAAEEPPGCTLHSRSYRWPCRPRWANSRDRASYPYLTYTSPMHGSVCSDRRICTSIPCSANTAFCAHKCETVEVEGVT
jgi:hypothetical protein